MQPSPLISPDNETSQSICQLIIFLSLFPTYLHSQDSIQYRKLYLHTDKKQYFLGDTIWYKAYYLDGQSNQFVPGLMTMYVDVINETGNIVTKDGLVRVLLKLDI
jgi:hypothetical protein